MIVREKMSSFERPCSNETGYNDQITNKSLFFLMHEYVTHQGGSSMKFRNTYTGAFKASIVRSWMNGQKTLIELGEEYNIHPNQIKNWKSSLLKQADKVLCDKRKKESAA